MKLRDRYYGGTTPLSIRQAVENDVISNDRGAMESMERTLTNTIELLGALIESLQEGGKISKEQVLVLLPKYQEVK